MKRMAALLAVMGALSGIVPAAATAASTSGAEVCGSGQLLFLRLC